MNETLYFETIKCFEEEVYNLTYHNKRIANTIGKNINLGEYIYPISAGLLKCKVIYSKDEIIDIKYSPYTPKDQKVFKLIEANNLNYKSKYLDRTAIDSLLKYKDSADDIIIIQDERITDTSIANIAIKKNNQWFTPTKALLEGTTRNRLIEEGFLKEHPITIKDLLEAESFAIMNAMIEFKEIKGFKFIT